MQKVNRPSSVPEEAVWDQGEKIWKHGAKKSRGVIRKLEIPVGEWRYWRPDGSLCCVANFDEEGGQHGVVERFHNDGTLASRGVWKHGSRHGHFVFIRSNNPTDEYYSGNAETWRYEFDSTANWEETNLRWFLEDGAECTSDGRSIATAYDLDTVIGASEPEDFLEKYAAGFLAAIGDDDREQLESSESSDLTHLAELWGVTAPEIDAFIKYTSDADSFNRATSSRRFEKNVWRAVIEHPWENESEELAALFMGAVKIGYFGDSDHVYVTIFRTRQEEYEPNAVFLWDHETYYVNEVLAPTLDEFAFRLAVAGAYDRERLSKTAARAAWRKLAGHSNVGWAACGGLETLTESDEILDEVLDADGGKITDADDKISATDGPIDKSEFQINLDPQNAIRGKFWRAQWIIQLLQRDSSRDMNNVEESFRPGWNIVLNDKNYNSLLESGRDRLYQTALYLLWRLFWFNDQVRLKECCDVFRDHPARVVRDLVELLEDIERGNSNLGSIENILAVREDFLAMDLAPEREEERSNEEEAVATADSARAVTVAKEAATLVKLGLPALLGQSWSNINDPLIMIEYEKVARTIPGYEMQWRAFDWVRNAGYVRADQSLTDEAISVGVWLGQNQSLILQPFIWCSMYSVAPGHLADLLLPAIATTPGALDPRLADCCIAQLDVVEEYNFKRRLSVELLGAMREQTVVPRLCGLIDEYFIAIGDKTDFDARLASIPWDDLLVTLCRTLNTLSDQADAKTAAIARGALRKLLTHCIKEHTSKAMASALESLVAWGDIDVLEFVGKLLNEPDDTEQIAALRVIEKLASQLDPEARRRFVPLEFRNPADHDNAVTLMYHRAANALVKADPDLGEAESITDALAEARTLGNYGTEAWLNWRLLECESVGRFPELDINSITHYRRSDNIKVRTAAESACTARGIALPPVRAAYWPLVWQTVDAAATSNAAGLEVAALLIDPETVDRTAPAAWLWDNPSEETAAIVAQAVDAHLDGYQPIGGGESLPSESEWLIRCLAKHAVYLGTSTTIERCLQTEHREIQACVVQEIEALPVVFAPLLLSIAAEDDGWPRCFIARWALARQEEPQISSALKDARITIAKLKNWEK